MPSLETQAFMQRKSGGRKSCRGSMLLAMFEDVCRCHDTTSFELCLVNISSRELPEPDAYAASNREIF